MGSSLLSIKTAAGVLAAAATVGLVASGAAAFVPTSAPRVYALLRACLTPPYIYFVVNGIIIAIAASSHLQRAMTGAPAPVPAAVREVLVAPVEREEADEERHRAFFATAVQEDELIAAPVAYSGLEEEVVRSQPRRRPPRREEPADFSRLGEQGRSPRVVPAGLGNTSEVVQLQPMFEETLESTWNTIKKSDAWADLSIHSRKDETLTATTPAPIPTFPPPRLDSPPKRREEERHVAKAAEEGEVGLKLAAPADLYGGVNKVINKKEPAVVEDEDVILQPPSLSHPTAAAAVEKPMVSSRFGHPRRSAKGNTDGKALGVARAKRDETLESTWKTITDGRAVPLARHLKKSDTWGDSHVPHQEPLPATLKSKTFHDRSGRPPAGAGSAPSSGGKLHKEASVGQEDLNRRVEAFINKVNQDMRLQREESIQHYIEMISRGSH